MTYRNEPKEDEWERLRREGARQSAEWNPLLLRERIEKLETELTEAKENAFEAELGLQAAEKRIKEQDGQIKQLKAETLTFVKPEGLIAVKGEKAK